jgi:hypothetical protein
VWRLQGVDKSLVLGRNVDIKAAQVVLELFDRLGTENDDVMFVFARHHAKANCEGLTPRFWQCAAIC